VADRHWPVDLLISQQVWDVKKSELRRGNKAANKPLAAPNATTVRVRDHFV
jgi:hypothetical protein